MVKAKAYIQKCNKGLETIKEETHSDEEIVTATERPRLEKSKKKDSLFFDFFQMYTKNII